MEPWLSKLKEGDSQGAWDLFAERYRRLMTATIRRLVPEHDDIMDVFASACAAFAENDFARLRRYNPDTASGATVSTWVVAVVRNLTIDWLRKRDGRSRATIPNELTLQQQLLFRTICLDGNSYTAAYELLRGSFDPPLTFAEFLREVRVTHRIAPCPDSSRRRDGQQPVKDADAAVEPEDLARVAELSHRIETALAGAPADVRLAVQLLIVERTRAAEIARLVQWPNAKAVYNRVYRALAAARINLEAQGIRREDLR